MAYAVGAHRHTPEIDQILGQATGAPVEALFTPHLAPMDRGIFTTCYATPEAAVGEGDLLDALREAYREQPFVRVVEELPATKHVSHTNFCDLAVRVARGRALVLACIDNLVKGASGAAVQNFNCMLGLDQTTGLM